MENNTTIYENLAKFNNTGVPGCLHNLVLFKYGSLPYYLGCYVFPLVFVIGVMGNLLNLIVLNSQGMRTKANCFLSAMAIVDLCFLLVMFILNLAVYDDLVSSKSFISFHFATKMAFIAMANGFSSSSIWFAIVVTVERLVAIRTPLHARSFWKSWRMALIIGCIVFFSFVLQIYNLVYITHDTLPLCSNKTQRLPYFRLIKQNEGLFYHYVQLSLTLTPIIQVTFPLLLLVLLNSMLLHYLWIHRKAVSRFGQSSMVQSNGSAVISKELKITMTVLIIVITFIIFNCPSAIVYWLTAKSNTVKYAATLSYLANFLVTVNKALNFVLYCTSSANFRRRLMKLFKNQVSKKRRLTSLYSTTSQEETKLSTIDTLHRFQKSRTNSGELVNMIEMQDIIKYE